jgi:uncharacterized protein YecE (DUF72 family)
MGRILIGISSWTEESLVKSGFYPSEIKTTEDRLQYYASNFPVVEVDATYHVLPARRNVAMWVEKTPPRFIFDIKAFSLFTQHPTPYNALPRVLRDKFGTSIPRKGNLYSHHLPQEALDELWKRYAEAVQAVYSTGKLGVVLFQFPPWFHPRGKNFDYIAEVRADYHNTSWQ